MGGFLTIRHNEIRDITASLLTEICHNVPTEPPLQPLTGETLSARSANTDDNARLDIRARGFWNHHQDAFFDVRVFYPNTPSNHSTNAYRRHEQAKKREYGQRVREVERGVFTPLVLSANGGMGKEVATFYRRLADMIAQKRQHPTPWSWDGSGAGSHSHPSDPPSCAFGEAVRHYTDLCKWTKSHYHLRRGMCPLLWFELLFVSLTNLYTFL